MELGGITQIVNMLDPVPIEVDFEKDKITFGQRSNILEINLSKDNINELGQKMYPYGLIPDSLPMKVIMLNQLVEELDIRDKENPDWRISKIECLEDDLIQFDCMEVTE